MMDPPATIWPFSINSGSGSDAASDCEYEMRRAHFGQGSGKFVGNPIDDELQGWTRQNGGGDKRYDHVSGEVSAKVVPSSVTSVMHDWHGKRNNLLGSSSDKGKREVEARGTSGHVAAKTSAKSAEPPKHDYIHVRARRGQATDSHSLAERARREKISERMKILQDLVPGCNKVIGKALVLDEIINYIHSLQHQVEFLSMKLEAVTSRLPPGLEALSSKVFGPQAFDPTGEAYPPQPPRAYDQLSSPDWLYMQVGSGFHSS